MGAKCWVLDRAGTFRFEEIPGNLLMIVCTHAGSGAFEARDLDGRKLIRMGPAAMGVWNLNAGFFHGLEVEISARDHSPIASVIWQSKLNGETASVSMQKKSKALVSGSKTLCRSSCIFTQLTITAPGSGQIEMLDGTGRLLWKIPSMFRGSFNVEHVFCEGGLVQRVSGSTHIEATAAWLESQET